MSQKWFIFGLLAIVLGFVLSIVSWLEICSEMCGATHNWRLYGFKFQDVGLIFFPVLLILHILGRKDKRLAWTAGALIIGALGAEAIFIGVQKFAIKAWCPVCLAIFGSLLLASLSYLQQEGIMKSWNSIGVFVIGVIVAFFGVGKIDPLEAALQTVKDGVVFGDSKSHIEIYLFTDWQCPACRKMEPSLPAILNMATRRAKFVFVDFDVHPETLNFVPYNLSFMINDKDKYLRLREVLTTVAKETGTPSDDDIKTAIKPLGVKYKQLNYADVALGIKYFQHLAMEFEINSTPTLVLVNNETKRGKKLLGWKDITVEKVRDAIDDLK